MGRKVITMLCCLLALAVAQPARASAASYSASGTLDSQQMDVFRRALIKHGINDDYVAFRTDQGEYVLVIAENMECSGGTFTAQACSIYRTYGLSWYSSQDTDFVLVAGDHLVYSNLGDYPDLQTPGDFFGMCSMCLLLVMIFMDLCRQIFGFNLRRR